LSGGLGFLYDLPFATVARLNGQYVERAPDAAELFSKGMHEATGTFEVGNPFLTKEKAATVEAGLKKATGAFRYDASVYYTHYQGFIYRQLTDVECGAFLDECGVPLPPDEESFRQVFFQQRNATFYLDYDARPEMFKSPQTATIAVGNNVVDTFQITSSEQTIRKIPIKAEQFGDEEMVLLRISVDKTFVPALVKPGSRDSRELGLRVFHVFVEPQ
jgi:outer membrane receptor protein involved in Fe transport